jgi:hypothetical protein
MNDLTIPRLAELQRRFQHHLLTGDAAIARAITDTEHLPVAMRLKVYSDAYRLRLIDVLADNYPRLTQLLGKQAFAELATRYLDLHPSHYRSVRWFGDRLPSMLKENRGAEPWLADLATFEWAVAHAFDAADSAALGVDALGRVPPEQWADLRFEVHPSAQRVTVVSNAPALFKALTEDKAHGEPASLGEPQLWLVWRQDLTPQYRSLEGGEAAAIDQLMAGRTFADICAALSDWHEEEHIPLLAAGLLKSWIADGLLTQLIVGND